MISIVIPALNEAERIVSLLETLSRLSENAADREVIVADGGSTDGTAEKAAPLARVVLSSRGRAFQMNEGAHSAKGDILWFLHSDSRVASSSLEDINRAISEGNCAGFFRLCFFDADDWGMRLIAWGSHLRARRLGQIFGDQALFIRRDTFEALGGFPEIPLMEDWEFSKRLRPLQREGKVCALDTPVGTSARRFIQKGRLKGLALNQITKLMHVMGFSPEAVRAFYEGRGRGL